MKPCDQASRVNGAAAVGLYCSAMESTIVPELLPSRMQKQEITWIEDRTQLRSDWSWTPAFCNQTFLPFRFPRPRPSESREDTNAAARVQLQGTDPCGVEDKMPVNPVWRRGLPRVEKMAHRHEPLWAFPSILDAVACTLSPAQAAFPWFVTHLTGLLHPNLR
jgi:hypothetical protein